MARLTVLEEANLCNQLVFIRNGINHLSNRAEQCFSRENRAKTEKQGQDPNTANEALAQGIKFKEVPNTQ